MDVYGITPHPRSREHARHERETLTTRPRVHELTAAEAKARIAVLDARLGAGVGAVRERGRLQERLTALGGAA